MVEHNITEYKDINKIVTLSAGGKKLQLYMRKDGIWELIVIDHLPKHEWGGPMPIAIMRQVEPSGPIQVCIEDGENDNVFLDFDPYAWVEFGTPFGTDCKDEDYFFHLKKHPEEDPELLRGYLQHVSQFPGYEEWLDGFEDWLEPKDCDNEDSKPAKNHEPVTISK